MQGIPLPATDCVIELQPKRVKPFARQPRKRFRGIGKLADSIRVVGQVTPIIVARCTEGDYDAELVDGERRLRACLLGKMPVRAVMEGDGDDAQRYVRSVAANFCRQPHDAVEIMEAVLALKESGRTIADIASVFGKTATWVHQYASLQRLHPEVLEQLKVAGDEAKVSKAERRRRGRMTLSLALLLVPLPQRMQVRAMRRIMRRSMSLSEARTFVHRQAVSEGVPVGKRMSPHERFRAVSAAVENCHHVVERYLRMPGVQIHSLVRGATPDERRRTSGQLESLCESLLMLADEIHKT